MELSNAVFSGCAIVAASERSRWLPSLITALRVAGILRASVRIIDVSNGEQSEQPPCDRHRRDQSARSIIVGFTVTRRNDGTYTSGERIASSNVVVFLLHHRGGSS